LDSFSATFEQNFGNKSHTKMQRRFLAKNSSASNRTFVCSGTPKPDGSISQLVCQAIDDNQIVNQPQLITQTYVQSRSSSRPNRGKCGDIDHPKPKAYVQGGAASGGIGTKTKPYNTLSQAEADTTWNTLVVLYSATTLDGGITLRPNTTIVGDDDGPAKPLLINSGSSSNGGNVIVVSGGDTSIINLEFTNVWASAIEFSDADDVNVVDCDIHDYNQGEIIVDLQGQDQEVSSIPIAGIHGQCQNSGKTTLCNVSIHDNHTGDGFLEVVYGNAFRKVTVSRTDFRNLVNVFPSRNLVNASIKGISVLVTSPTAKHEVYIANSKFEDFPSDGVSTGGENFAKHAIFAESDNGGETSIIVDKCCISNIFQDSAVSGTAWIYAGTHPTVNISNKKSIMNIIVTDSSFTAPNENATDFMAAIITNNCNGLMTSDFSNNTITNIALGFVSYSKGIARDKLSITGNVAQCLASLYTAISEEDYITNITGAMHTHVTVKNNNLTGGNIFGGVGIIPHMSSGIGIGVSKWKSLIIDVKNNCFNGAGQNTGMNAGLFALDFFGYGVATSVHGGIKINASRNNFVNYPYAIFDALGNAGINAEYNVKDNYWGAIPLIPMTNSIVLFPSTTNISSNSDSLTHQIMCPNVDSYTTNTAKPMVTAYAPQKKQFGAAIDVTSLLDSLAPTIAKFQGLRL
jgi:hypothetical protein